MRGLSSLQIWGRGTRCLSRSLGMPAPSVHTDAISEGMTVCLGSPCQLGGLPGSGKTDTQTRSEPQLACLVQRSAHRGWRELSSREMIYPFG